MEKAIDGRFAWYQPSRKTAEDEGRRRKGFKYDIKQIPAKGFTAKGSRALHPKTITIRSMTRFKLSKNSFLCLRLFLMAWLGGTLLVGCAPFASVGVVIPSPPIALTADQSTEELKQARSEMKVSEELAKTNPKEAMAQSEAAAMLSLEAQKRLSGPRADEATALYNYAVARLVEQVI